MYDRKAEKGEKTLQDKKDKERWKDGDIKGSMKREGKLGPRHDRLSERRNDWRQRIRQEMRARRQQSGVPLLASDGLETMD